MKTSINHGLCPKKFWVKDIDGNVLKTYKVGKYLITENLKTEHYNDGTSIPIIEDAEEWEKDTAGAMCYYNNDRKHKEKCGALYNSYAVDTGKLAPEGFRILTDDDWKEIEIVIGMSKKEADKREYWRGKGIGDKMKEALGVVFAGCRGGRARDFHHLSTYARWWSSSVCGPDTWNRGLNSDSASIIRYPSSRYNGFSVRCIKELSDINCIQLRIQFTIE